jgi:hypothetical protein
MSYSQLRPLSIGEILDGAFTIYRRQFASLFLTALLPQLPMILLVVLYYTFLGSFTISGSFNGTSMAAGIAGLILLPVALMGTCTSVAGVTFQVARAYTGAPVGSNEAIRRGFQRALPLLGAYILVGMLAMFGLIAFIVGFFVVWVSAFAVAPAVVLEECGPTDAISRSWALIKGAWGEVLAVMFIAGMIAALPGFAVGFIATVLGVITSGADPAGLMAAQAVGQVLSQLVRTAAFPFSLGATVLLYYDRRVRNEALDVQLMAEALPTAQPPQPPAYYAG